MGQSTSASADGSFETCQSKAHPPNYSSFQTESPHPYYYNSTFRCILVQNEKRYLPADELLQLLAVTSFEFKVIHFLLWFERIKGLVTEHAWV